MREVLGEVNLDDLGEMASPHVASCESKLQNHSIEDIKDQQIIENVKELEIIHAETNRKIRRESQEMAVMTDDIPPSNYSLSCKDDAEEVQSVIVVS